ncbi:mediator complex, subunit Med20 [Zopfochytrium polystomum]|nr:mediator complex, subunit Med20 [Zopfochytrium polystomum]
MASTRIFFFRNAESEAAGVLQERISKTFLGHTSSRWRVACRLYLPAPVIVPGLDPIESPIASRALYTLSNSTSPLAIFALVVDRSTKEEAFIAGERELEPIFGKLKQFWILRQTLTIEGLSFKMIDSTVRLGTVFVGSIPRGIVLEVSTADGQPAHIKSLLQNILTGFPFADFESPLFLRRFEQEVIGDSQIAFQIMKILQEEGMLASS